MKRLGACGVRIEMFSDLEGLGINIIPEIESLIGFGSTIVLLRQ